MTTPHAAYQSLVERFRRIALLGDAQAILSWDSATTMRPGSAEARAEVDAALALEVHERRTAPDLGEVFAAVDATTLDPWQRANLDGMRRTWLHATAVPADLVEAASRAASQCEHRWRTARHENDFDGLAPLLRTVLASQREIAAAKAEALGVSRYDALLDQYEPGGTSARIDQLFDELSGFLPDLIATALERQASRPAPLPLDGHFPVAAQRDLGQRLMAALGFDFDRGRLDVSAHPFCGGTPDDLRLTTRYNEQDFARALMGTLHETGHALYEAGLPAEWRHQPVGTARGMSIHESQSLFVEMQLCRSLAFQHFLAPLAREAFGVDGPAWTPENLYAVGTRVQRSLIRVDADECTYPAHVLLRYRLERQMIDGALDVADLPDAWAEGMRRLIGITPPDHKDGCLQDIHWPSGAFGYFPTYTLGAMTAAQLREAVDQAIPDLESQLAAGHFAPVVSWLRDAIHRRASSLPTDALLTHATGRPLDVAAYRRHLERRYLG
ncbi:MAG: carboxypeptidase M32 [Alphaproteobacteria bacterium]|nr:carboxypeptidase M32 [Alphaproteobacteria bacterium]